MALLSPQKTREGKLGVEHQFCAKSDKQIEATWVTFELNERLLKYCLGTREEEKREKLEEIIIIGNL